MVDSKHPLIDPDPAASLAPGPCVDSDHPAVKAFATAHIGERASSPKEQAARLYLAVRDGLRYDPYRIDLSEAGLKASKALELGYGWCVTKAALYAAVLRAVGIPARLGFADVKNHLSTQKLLDRLGTNVFAWHGYTEVWLDDRWLKATPAFNVSLCEKFGLLPLDFDGTTDSIYHPFDREGNKHMEYLAYRGAFVDVPIAEIADTFRRLYRFAQEQASIVDSGDWEADVAREQSKG